MVPPSIRRLLLSVCAFPFRPPRIEPSPLTCASSASTLLLGTSAVSWSALVLRTSAFCRLSGLTSISDVRAARPGLKIDAGKRAHALRLAARYRCLQETRLTRHDSENVSAVDVDASSQPCWSKWRKALNAHELLLLTIYRGGASSTPTRRQSMPQNSTSCPFCDRRDASMRHFWAECPAFEPSRSKLRQQFGIPNGWFQAQPRITAKIGWITFSSSPCKAKRALRTWH